MLGALLLLLPPGEGLVERLRRHPEVEAWAVRVRRFPGVRPVAMEEGAGEVGLFESHPEHLVRWASFRIEPSSGRLQIRDAARDVWRPFP